MKINISLILSISTVLLLLFSSCSENKIPEYKETRTPIKVNIAKVSDTQNTSQFTTNGLVASNNKVELSSKVMGYIEYLKLNIGDRVNAGSIVAKIKNQEVNTKIDQINGQIEEVQISEKAIKKDYNRIKRLVEQNSATQKELDDITAMLESTQSKIKQLNSAKSEVSVITSYAEIRSPLTGVVTAKYKDQGEMANPGQAILSIQGTKGMVIEISIPESLIRNIKRNATVEYKFNDESEWQTGKINEIAAAAMSGQYMAKIALPSSQGLLTGMFMDVRIPLPSNSKTIHSNSITIPQSALVKKGQLTGVFIPSDQKTALLRWISVGTEQGEQIEVLSGLSAGDLVIVSAESRLVNGVPVSY